MPSLTELRNVPFASRYALLPEPLRPFFEKQRASQRLWGVVRGVVVFGAGAALVGFEYSPPLSSEERMFIGYGVVAMLVSFMFAAWAFKVPDPALWVLTDEDVVWAYRKVVRGGRQYLVLASDRGVDASLRLDEDGAHLSEDAVARALSALHGLHPGLHFGFGPELASAYAQKPASLRREGAARAATWIHHAYRKRIAILWGLIGLVLVFAMVIEPMIRLSSKR